MIDTWEKIIDPNFINAELIGEVGDERTVTIADIDFKEAFDPRTQSKSQKQTLFFEECKPMILNKTNAKQLKKMFKSDTPSDIVGKKITLYVVSLNVAGKQTTGIRIKEYSEIKCEDCGNAINGISGHSAEEIAKIGMKQYGRRLCLECAKKVKEASND